MSAAAPLHNRIRGATVPVARPANGPSLRLLVPAVIAATIAISQFALPWARPEGGVLIALALATFLLVPNGIAWALGAVLICELTIASYYFAAYGLSLRLIVTGIAVVVALPTILRANRADPRYRRVFIFSGPFVTRNPLFPPSLPPVPCLLYSFSPDLRRRDGARSPDQVPRPTGPGEAHSRAAATFHLPCHKGWIS